MLIHAHGGAGASGSSGPLAGAAALAAAGNALGLTATAVAGEQGAERADVPPTPAASTQEYSLGPHHINMATPTRPEPPMCRSDIQELRAETFRKLLEGFAATANIVSTQVMSDLFTDTTRRSLSASIQPPWTRELFLDAPGNRRARFSICMSACYATRGESATRSQRTLRHLLRQIGYELKTLLSYASLPGLRSRGKLCCLPSTLGSPTTPRSN